MARVADVIVPNWLGQVECRKFRNRRDFYESVGLRYIINEPHFRVWEQLKLFYIVEQQEGKNSFEVKGLTELGKHMLQIKESLGDWNGSRIIFQ